MNPSLLHLHDLRCAYGDGPLVLTVPQLEVAAGELVFVVGVSGGGKSTLLETVGLMNKTLKGSGKMLFAEQNLEQINISSLWNQSEQLDDFRKRHFSFIFQKTNLMPNFSCGENMVLPALFKGLDFKVAKSKVEQYMDQLGLDRSIFNKRIVNVSGGQRQRLAFIRAMAADFSILFGDEPTGNLDANTAREVMTVLSNHLHENGKTGIVVSHDIDLALEFADRIIPITMITGNGDINHGTVDAKNILTKNESGNWSDTQMTHPQPNLHLQKLIA